MAVKSRENVTLQSLIGRDEKTVVVWLSHFADLTSTELVQRLKKIRPILQSSNVKLVAVGLGNYQAGQEFQRLNKIEDWDIYVDAEATSYNALDFNPGFSPTLPASLNINISPYAKLIPMLLGIGSPGTVQEVVRGYVGDRSSPPIFDSTWTPFDVLGKGYQRPFELATLRLFNMASVLSNWGSLIPEKEELLLQQGGTIVFDGHATVFRHADSGILRYCDVDELLRQTLKAEEVEVRLTV